MTENTIFIRKYHPQETPIPVNEKEIWRYAGYFGIADSVDEELRCQLDEVMAELKDAFAYKVCFRRMDVRGETLGRMNLPFGEESEDLRRCLQGSEEIILFAATIGLDIDRCIAKWQRLSPVKALLMQAYGAERVESLCNLFCKEITEEIAQEGYLVTPRFSPGYGDLPLSTQREVFRLLDCNRQIGISLNESLLMTPSKSVTAVFGIGTCVETTRREHKCENCTKTDCMYRKCK